MRTRLLLVAACAVCGTAGTCDIRPPDSVIHAEISPEELAAAPGYHQMKAALIGDVRIWRELDKKVETEGRREVPLSVTFVAGVATCSADKTEFEIYRLKEDLLDQPYRVDETAFLCRKESVYYYHYQGGPRKLDVWMGPFRIERKRPQTDDAPR
ncbi:MAG: hypothetical protein HY293_20075 [Planctomycetes bacterium]|nr:hypothetical protein [Planctomycetota bacterium]